MNVTDLKLSMERYPPIFHNAALSVGSIFAN
jgi:hypothetical protein